MMAGIDRDSTSKMTKGIVLPLAVSTISQHARSIAFASLPLVARKILPQRSGLDSSAFFITVITIPFHSTLVQSGRGLSTFRVEDDRCPAVVHSHGILQTRQLPSMPQMLDSPTTHRRTSSTPYAQILGGSAHLPMMPLRCQPLRCHHDPRR